MTAQMSFLFTLDNLDHCLLFHRYAFFTGLLSAMMCHANHDFVTLYITKYYCIVHKGTLISGIISLFIFIFHMNDHEKA